MQAILKQRNFLSTQIFEITDKSLKIKIKKPLHYFETEFSFESIGNNINRHKKPNTRSLLSFLASSFLTVVFYFWWADNNQEMPLIVVIGVACVAVLNALGYFYFRENFVNLFLYSDGKISFYATSPNPTEVDGFIGTLLKSQKAYLLERYAKADGYLTTEQLSNNLQWLWDRRIINDAELSDLRLKLLPRPSNPVGFKINPEHN